jgi:tetratricopeptide (TPR) repeat protein
MSISLLISDRNLFNNFFEKFQLLNKNNDVSELELLEVLINKIEVSEDRHEKILACINLQNFELITALLESYPGNSFKLEVLKVLNNMLPGNSSILNKLGLYLVSLKRFNEAEQYLLKSYEHNPNDPSTVFYLVSVFLQNNKPENIPSLISSAEDTFKNIPEITSRLNILKQKLNIF